MALTKVASAGIVDDTIAESKLDIHAAPSGTDKYLKYTSNGMEWATVAAGGISDIVSDTSPQLGGDLDTNSFEISLDDDHKVKFGDGSDLQIYHAAGTINRIDSVNEDLAIRRAGTAEDMMIKCVADGAVELYNDGVKKFETNADGVVVNGVTVSTGNIQINNDTGKVRLGASQDLELYHDGSHSYITNAGTGRLYINAEQINLHNKAVNENMLRAVENGAVTLYYDASSKFETHSTGASWSGDLTTIDGGVIKLGTGNDLQLYHDGSGGNSYIGDHGTGGLIITTDSLIQLQKGTSEVLAKFTPDGAAELYYDNVKKINSSPSGVEIHNDAYFSTDNGSAYFGASQDLRIFHDGTDSYITNNTGYFRIRDATNSRDIAKFHSTNSQEFYFNGSKKLEVTNTGISVTGSVTPTGGIYLGGSGGGNALNDYEKGTWTPGLANDSGTAFSATVSEAHYTKIGRLVNIFLYWSSMANIPNNSSSFQITGLPFAVDGAHHGWGQIGYAATHDCAHWNPLATTDGTNIYFHRTDGSGATPTNADWTACTHLILGLQYETAS